MVDLNPIVSYIVGQGAARRVSIPLAFRFALRSSENDFFVLSFLFIALPLCAAGASK